MNVCDNIGYPQSDKIRFKKTCEIESRLLDL